MYCFDGLSEPEIADSLGVTKQAVSKHLAAGRRKLAKLDMSPRKLEMAERPLIVNMDSGAIDRLDPGSLRGRW